MRPIKVAVVATHPIQYQVPWIRGLASTSTLEVKVYFGLLPTPEQQGEGFGIPFQWDIPMLEGYAWEALWSARQRPSLRGFWGNSTPGIFRSLRNARPDVLVLTGWNALPLLQAAAAGLILRIPMVMRAESNALPPRALWKRCIHGIFLRSFAGVLAIGRSNRQFYVQNGVAEDRIGNAPYFIDNVRVQRDHAKFLEQRDRLRSEWGIPKDALCFIYAGKLQPKKRIMDLLQAMRMVQESRSTSVHLLVVGAGEMLFAAKEYCVAHGIATTFAGFLNQTEMASGYAAADCLILPSDYGETWGLVVNEAMACGLPVIVSDRVGCASELVESGETGYTFRFGDIAALANAMMLMLRDPERMVRMGMNARKRIGAYSVEAAVEGTRRMILNVLGRATS